MVIVRTENWLFLIVIVKLEEKTNSLNSASHQIIPNVKSQETSNSAFRETIFPVAKGQIIW